jgi:hypothetical protein
MNIWDLRISASMMYNMFLSFFSGVKRTRKAINFRTLFFVTVVGSYDE